MDKPIRISGTGKRWLCSGCNHFWMTKSQLCPYCDRDTWVSTKKRSKPTLVLPALQARISQLESENQALKARVGKAEDVVLAARNASREIQAQRVNWPAEVDTLADALAYFEEIKS